MTGSLSGLIGSLLPGPIITAEIISPTQTPSPGLFHSGASELLLAVGGQDRFFLGHHGPQHGSTRLHQLRLASHNGGRFITEVPNLARVELAQEERGWAVVAERSLFSGLLVALPQEEATRLLDTSVWHAHPLHIHLDPIVQLLLKANPQMLERETWREFVLHPSPKTLDDFIDDAKEAKVIAGPVVGQIWKQWHNIQTRFFGETFRDKDRAPDPSAVQSAFQRIAHLSTVDLLKGTLAELPNGCVVTRYDPNLQTNLYFTVTATTEIVDGRLGEIPPDAKAIAVWFHGTGTTAANGGNFAEEMGNLTMYGIASVAFDYPYHGRGPCDDALKNTKRFSDWVEKIISRYRSSHPDKKIVLVGHSFGPTSILEYLAHYPTGADGAILLSPAGRFTPKMIEYYRTTVMHYLERLYQEGGDHLNAAGDLWGDLISAGLTFLERPAPTIPMLSVVGEHDQWFPDMEPPKELAAHFPTMRLSILPGVDHYPFGWTVEDFDWETQARLFGVLPEGKKKKHPLVSWMIVDFLRSRMEVDVPLEPADRLNNIGTIRKTLQLLEMNSLFEKAAGVGAKDISDLKRAEQTLRLWHAVKDFFWIDLFGRLATEQPDFYARYHDDIEKVRTALAKEGKLSGEVNHVFSTLLAKLKHELVEEAQKERLRKRGGFGVAAVSEDGSQGKNHWTRLLQYRLTETPLHSEARAQQNPFDLRQPIVFSEYPFGSPRALEDYFTSGHIGEPEDDLGAGGYFITQLVTQLGAMRLYGVYYFELNDDGSIRYVDDGFANAEVRFEDPHGEVKTIRFVQSEERANRRAALPLSFARPAG